MQTAIAQRSRHSVSLRGQAEKLFEVHRFILPEGAVGVSGPVARHQWNRPPCGLGLGTSDVSTGASSAIEKHGEVPAQAAGLRVFTSNQLSPDHRRTANACSQCGHDHIVKAASRSGILFAKECHASVIFNSQEEAEFLPGPCHEIDPDRIIIFLVG
jgi:hypothetical protein